MGSDQEHLSKILRRLTPQQEKVVRLYFGLGCKRSHSVAEIAEEFGGSSALISDILGAATKELAKAGITMEELQAASGDVTGARRTRPHHRHRRPE
jgi:DNA-directed RNA polymerase sigma subunit (sigma70/sigma32)